MTEPQTDDFAVAFREAMEDGGTTPDQPDPDTPPQEPEPQEPAGGELEPEPSPEPAPEPEPEPPAQPVTPQPEPKPDEDYRHKWLSLQGMYNSELKKRQELEQQIAQLRQPAPTPTTTPDVTPEQKSAPAKTTATLRDELVRLDKVNEFIEEYADVSEPVLAIAEHLQERFTKQLEDVAVVIYSAVQPFIEKQATADAEAHLAAIKGAHSDFESLRDSGALAEWIKAQPAYKQEAYIKAYNQGTATEVIDLINTYKQVSNGAPAPDTRPSPKLSGLEAVKTKRGPISPKATGVAGKDDYEGAFAEASKI